MKILLTCPQKLHTVPMGNYAYNALKNLGHDTFLFNFSSNTLDKVIDTITKSKTPHLNLNKRFLYNVKALKPDLVITIFGFDISEESFIYLRKANVPTACWWLNDPFQFDRSLKKANNYDFLFTNSLGSISDYRKAGIQQAYWLPTACDPKTHFYTNPNPKYASDICFAGDWSPLREAWCVELARHFDIKIFGPWKRKISSNSTLHQHIIDGFFTPKQMREIFSSAKIVFNLHTWYGKWDHGTNPRLFEAAGCASCQIVDWKKDIDQLFNSSDELFLFKNQNELVEKIKFLLNMPQEFRDTIRHKAQLRAYTEHTYEKRMNTILDTIGKYESTSSKVYK